MTYFNVLRKAKEFSLTANYAKGQSSMFDKWMSIYHPAFYLYPNPILHACEYSPQYPGVKSAPTVSMNLPYYLRLLC